MPRFYFDLSDEIQTIIDEQGVCANTSYEAILHAQEVIREMREEGDENFFDKGWSFKIRSEDGMIVNVLPI
ncbi:MULTISPECIES: DUF6894 family protein [Methylobacterium]|uniref:DUF6894 family protein n=1 Tax=Methylobacterium TaxID=407 RepID=UPI0037581BB7